MSITNSLRLTDKHHTGEGVPQEHARQRQASAGCPHGSAFGFIVTEKRPHPALWKQTFEIEAVGSREHLTGRSLGSRRLHTLLGYDKILIRAKLLSH